MIETIKGEITALNPASVTVETAGGVGYLINISLPTFTALEQQSSAKLYIHEAIREDAWVLYGFLDEDEREMFRLLVGVSGVGAASARMILSAIASNELRSVIVQGDVRSLKSVKGIGAKTAERIIVDLKDKIKVDAVTLIDKSHGVTPKAFDEALEALVILGFQRQGSIKALKKVFSENPDLTIEKAIKKAMSLI